MIAQATSTLKLCPTSKTLHEEKKLFPRNGAATLHTASLSSWAHVKFLKRAVFRVCSRHASAASRLDMDDLEVPIMHILQGRWVYGHCSADNGLQAMSIILCASFCGYAFAFLNACRIACERTQARCSDSHLLHCYIFGGARLPDLQKRATETTRTEIAGRKRATARPQCQQNRNGR